MSQEEKPAAMDADEVRRLINQWSDTGVFRVKNLGDRVYLEDVIPHAAYTLRLQTQYEDRLVSKASVPFKGGAVDEHGWPPKPWDISVRRPADFEERSEKVPVPHTERVESCKRCGGDGLVRCDKCEGWGKVNCSRCDGKGFRVRTRNAGEVDEFGRTLTMPETTRETCSQCSSGKIECPTCKSRGKVSCADCEGCGRIKTFDQLSVRFHAATLSEVQDTTALPDELVGQAAGEVLLDDRQPYLERRTGLPADLEQRVNGVLQKSQAVDGESSRVLFQHLHIEQVSIQEVAYRYMGTPTKHLWIYGSQRQIYAPGAPRPWGKILAILGGVAAAGVVVLGVVLALAR